MKEAQNPFMESEQIVEESVFESDEGSDDDTNGRRYKLRKRKIAPPPKISTNTRESPKTSKKGKTKPPRTPKRKEISKEEKIKILQSKYDFYPFIEIYIFRDYFHSSNFTIISDIDSCYNSEDEITRLPEWQKEKNEKLIDEFSDVSLIEKNFMKKWNSHLMEKA